MLDVRKLQSAGDGVHAAEEKNSGAELAPQKNFSFLSNFLAVSRQANKKICSP